MNYTTLKLGIIRKHGMEKIPLTIFIHGTHPVEPLLHLPFVHRFYRCPQGITLLPHLPDSHTKDFLTTLCSKYPGEFPAEHCYAFGWSGDLSNAARKQAASDLFKDLVKLCKDHKHGRPHLRIITHSHGGNVALSLKHIADATQSTQLLIDELILLACPVQGETADYAGGSLFKEIYSIHSHYDLLQVIDPQGVHLFLEYLKNYGLEFTLSHLKALGPLFSERHFPKHLEVTELYVTYPHRELFHIEFLLPRFLGTLPILIKKAQDHQGSEELTHICSDDH